MKTIPAIAPDRLMWASFERFELQMTWEAAQSCSHSGACDDDVGHWSPRITRPDTCTPTALAAELKEYGAWDKTELADDAANWQRIVWLAAGRITDEPEAALN